MRGKKIKYEKFDNKKKNNLKKRTSDANYVEASDAC